MIRRVYSICESHRVEDASNPVTSTGTEFNKIHICVDIMYTYWFDVGLLSQSNHQAQSMICLPRDKERTVRNMRSPPNTWTYNF